MADLTLNISQYSPLQQFTVRPWETFSPSDQLIITDKINLIIQTLNRLGKLSNDVVTDWNKVMTWVSNDGMTAEVDSQLQKWIDDGTLVNLIKLYTGIGDLTTLQTVAKDSLVNAINENVTHFNDLSAKQGDITQLNTNDKTSVVNALKEIKLQANTNASNILGINAGPKGIYATLSALQTAFPTGNNNIYIVTADGNWYYWNGSAWTAGGVYQSTSISDGSVTEKKTVFFDITTQPLTNRITPTLTSGFKDTTGAISTNAQYSYSQNIPVLVGDVITFTTNNVPNAPARVVCALDSNGNAVSASGASSVTQYTVPTGIASIVVTVDTTNYTGWIIVQSTTQNIYTLKNQYQKVDDIVQALISKKVFFTSKNRYDKTKVTQGYLMGTDGNKTANSSYCYSDFIAVNPGDIVAISVFTTDGTKLNVGSRYITAYNSTKTAVTASGTTTDGTQTYVVPAGISYIICSFNTSYYNSNNIQVEITQNGNYSEYEMINDSYRVLSNIVKPPSLDVFLPPTIYCAVGRTIELYNNQVCLQANQYNLNWKCSVGKNLKRKFSVTGTTGLKGVYDLTLEVVDTDLNILWSGVTKLNIVSNTVPIKTICPIGDSLTNNKNWLSEIMTLTSGNISYVGTRPFNNADSNNVAKSGFTEGRSGFSASNYLTASSYTFESPSETTHPFWDGTRFNWSYYKTNKTISPNAIQIWLGINGISLDNTQNAANIKQMVDYIRQDDSSIPIYMVYTIFKGNQNGIGVQQSTDGYSATSGQYKYSEDKKVMDLMKKLYVLLKAYTNVYFIPTATCHDSENNFGAVSTAVNPRASQTELMPTEGTHPQTQGYYQIADIIYSTYCGTLI